MDWKAVQEKCPRAWAEFVRWLMSQEDKHRAYGSFEKVHINEDTGQLQVVTYNGHSAFTTIIYEPRNLFDFFDENGIFVFIGRGTIGGSKLMFSFTVNGDTGVLKTRTLAESAAFAKAFEILEQQLTKE